MIPPGIKRNFEKNTLDVKALLIAYHQIRDQEEWKEKIEFLKGGIRA